MTSRVSQSLQEKKKKLFTQYKTDNLLSSWSNSKQHPIIESLLKTKTLSEVSFVLK